MVVTWNEENAAHLLRRAGFGPRPPEVASAVKKGMAKTIAGLFKPWKKSDKLPKKPKTDSLEDLQAWWLRRMLATKSPLIEKMALFWHNHFATALSKVERLPLMHQQNRTLRKLAVGKFSTLCLALARDPAMVIWLDNISNIASDPNENFARELMELFTTGVLDAAGQPNYTETDVQESARAFTGWTLDDKFKFVFDPANHDFGTKTFRGQTANFDGTDIVAMLVVDPATARRLAWKSWSFFAYETTLDDPVLDPLVAAYLANDTSITALLKAIFEKDEFYSATAKRARVKSPAELLVGALRQLGAKISKSDTGVFEAANAMQALGQSIFEPPTVFGWKEGLQWISTNGLLERLRLAETIADARTSEGAGFVWNPAKLLGPKKKQAALTAADVVAAVLGALSQSDALQATVATLESYLQTDENGQPVTFFVEPASIDVKVRGLVALILSSPEYQIA
jgi:uncharacterized protein (DUF1800 family)